MKLAAPLHESLKIVKPRPFLSILRMQLTSRLQYRMALWAGMATNAFWGFVHVVIIMTFYRYGQQGALGSGMTMTQAVSYAWLAQIVLHLLPNISADGEVREKIRNGDIGVELCRPLDLYAHWYARAVASRLGAFLQRFGFVAAFAMLLPEPYRLQPPASVAGLAASLLALSMGLLLSCSLVGIAYVMLLRVSWGDGPVQMLITTVEILSGAYLPLQLWPIWAQRILLLQPFAGIMDIPLRLYIGTLSPNAVWGVLVLQALWMSAMVAFGRLWMKRSLTHLVVQGG